MIVAALFFLMELNQWQFERAGYDTHDSYASFRRAFGWGIALLSALGTALMVTLVLPGGGAALSLLPAESDAAFQGLHHAWASFERILLVGSCGPGLGSGSHRLHCRLLHGGQPVWSLGTPGSELLRRGQHDVSLDRGSGHRSHGLHQRGIPGSAFLPSPLWSGWTKSRVLAVILPAFFLEFFCTAPIRRSPGYIRGIEVGIIGVVAGMVMLRWGILATLIWHYTVDASLVGMLLIRFEQSLFQDIGRGGGSRRACAL